MSYPSVDLLKNSLKKYNIIANEAVKCFSFIRNCNLELLNYSENAIYLLQDSTTTTEQMYILRVGRPGYHTKREVESELEWIKAIDRQSKLMVSLPILGDNLEYIQEVKYGDELFYCILFDYLKGSAPEENNEQELVRQFEVLGEITAQLHEHVVNHREDLKHISRLTWNYETILGPEPKWGRWQVGLGMTSERINLYEKVSEKIKKRLEKFGKSRNRYGLIHSDLRLANLLVEGEEIKVIDFDDCGFGWFLYDCAASLSFIEHKDYVPSLIASWLKGYRKIRPLSLEEEQEIPTFMMMRRLQLIAWIGSRDNETTRSLGSGFTVETDALAEKYLNELWID